MKQARLFPKGPTDDERDGVPVAPPPSREQLRSRRRWETRATSVSMRRLPKRELERERVQLALLEETDPIGHIERPKTRGDCIGGARPCPFVSCKHHLYLDVSPKTGAIKFNRPELAPEQLVESCALDVAERGGTTLEAAGALMNVTRERIRQVELKALATLESDPRIDALRELHGLPKDGKRRLPVVEQDFDAGRFASADLDE